jgi:hypothetical protein
MAFARFCFCKNNKRTINQSSCVGNPRRTFSAKAAPVSAYRRDLGLDEPYHTFASILQSNRVSPHQVLLDDNIDSFRRVIFCLSVLLLGAYRDFPSEGSLRGGLLFSVRPFYMFVSMRRADIRVCVRVFFLVSVFGGLDPLLFATRWSRWSRHLVEDHNPSFMFIAMRDI